MLGVAGIGYAYLRLHDPAVPSILIVRPEEYAGRGL
jgi:lantibiotic modifying enzyme